MLGAQIAQIWATDVGNEAIDQSAHNGGSGAQPVRDAITAGNSAGDLVSEVIKSADRPIRGAIYVAFARGVLVVRLVLPCRSPRSDAVRVGGDQRDLMRLVAD